ncbi:hypothetical protein [endosymbiont GvMRE of Glomus versiforme]|uniref:hypothetical protein n=1 Tax=endosymbiont GvMRE of Glomus versiforme TaxID=2039283 RepID=UPI000ED7C736|nr:hypothetical protein [endosymbiont GvMRE of Glomus versiforme]RHZ36341.1 hypothetical protein GvMRE_Ic1g139 [endosymbiont GvMRE of Glomus versiforme]
MRVFLLILIWLVGLASFALSFFFGEQSDFSPSQESEEQIYKNTGFTKLTKQLQAIYLFLMFIFFVLIFVYNYAFFN